MKGTSVHIKNMRIKQLCNRKIRDFAMACRARKVSEAFEKRAPELFFVADQLIVSMNFTFLKRSESLPSHVNIIFCHRTFCDPFISRKHTHHVDREISFDTALLDNSEIANTDEKETMVSTMNNGKIGLSLGHSGDFQPGYGLN